MAREVESELLTDGGKAIPETTAEDAFKFPAAAKDYRQMKSSPPSPIRRQGNAKEYFTGSGRVTPSPAMSGGGKLLDDSYFDAHPWFDSDNEDFLSVNGDFGSSRSFTPIINRIDSGTDPNTQATPPQLNRSSSGSNTGNPSTVRPSRSSSSVKKQLIEFFSESFSRDLRTEMEEESTISKQHQPLVESFHKYGVDGTPSTGTDRTTSSTPRESMSKPIFDDPMTTTKTTTTATTTNKKSAVKKSCILLVRSLSCGGGGNVAHGGKKKRSRRHDHFKQ